MHFLLIFYCLIYYLYFFVKSEILLNNQLQYEDTYLKKAIQATLKRNDLIVYTNHHRDILHILENFTKILVSYEENLLGLLDYANMKQVDVYILSLSENVVEKVLKQLKQMLIWNPRGKFIILYSGNVNAIFALLIQYFIYNALVVSSEEEKGYTYFPYKYENCNNPEIGPQEVTLNEDYFPEKLPKLWRNSSLLSINVKLQPYVICSECKTGVELEFVENVMKSGIKFNLKYLQTDLYWGTKLSNGTYNYALGIFMSQSADIAIGHFHIRDLANIVDFDITVSYMDDDVVWVVPTPGVLPHSTNILHIFDPTSWIFILATILISSLFWSGISYLCPEETGHFKNIWNTMTMPIRFLVSEVPGNVPKSHQVKILYIVTWLFIYELDVIWEAYLVYFLTHENYGHQISEVDEVIKSGMRMAIAKPLAWLFKRSGSKSGLDIFKEARKLAESNHIMEEIQRTAFLKDTVTSSTKRVLNYLIPFYFQHDNGRAMVFKLKEIIVKDYTVMFVRKGHPVFPRINEVLNWARAGGFIEYYERKLAHLVAISNNQKMSKLGLFDTKAITLAQMQGILILYCSGCAVATLVFIVEKKYFSKK